MADYNFAELESLWVLEGGSQATAAIAAAVALAESNGHSDAVSSAGDVGLWQINAPSHPNYNRASLFDPAYNAKAAIAISSNGANWRPWCTAYTDGACGTRGGVYAPFGASPAGREYVANGGQQATQVGEGGAAGSGGAGGWTDTTQAHVAFKRLQLAILRDLPRDLRSAASTVHAARRHLARRK